MGVMAVTGAFCLTGCDSKKDVSKYQYTILKNKDDVYVIHKSLDVKISNLSLFNINTSCEKVIAEYHTSTEEYLIYNKDYVEFPKYNLALAKNKDGVKEYGYDEICHECFSEGEII